MKCHTSILSSSNLKRLSIEEPINVLFGCEEAPAVASEHRRRRRRNRGSDEALAAARETSVDAAGAVTLTRLGDIFALKEEQD